ncbi:hypothetical protein F5Y14DRAFT_456111 [Nemania sp. NC0429]|nr:hypothetical protein F5Y14DRAFT_456111 [Nemania sp. NC0429]
MPFKPSQFFTDCLGFCFPVQPPVQVEEKIRRADHYNSRLRANLGLPERSEPNRPMELATTAAPTTAAPMTVAPMTAALEQPQANKKVRFDTAEPQEWAKTYMNRQEMRELFNKIHETLGHTPYAIGGLGSLIDHGSPGRMMRGVSIICPRVCRDAVQAWIATKGCITTTGDVGLPLKDGTVRRVRIKYLQQGFEKLHLVRSSFSKAIILSLSSQLDQVAAGYLDHKQRGNTEQLEVVAGDVFFLLGQMADRREKIDTKFLPTFLGEAFFKDFTAKYDKARTEMARAGIDVASVLARHNSVASLREHNEMLGKYGLSGDAPPTSEAGLFEGQNLKGQRSVYTLREPDSRTPGIVLRQPTMRAPMRRTGSYVRLRPGGNTNLQGSGGNSGAARANLGVPPGRNLTSSWERAPPVEKPGPGWI